MARSGELAMKKEMPQCLHSLVTVVCEASAVDLARVSAESPAELLNKTRDALRNFGGIDDLVALMRLRELAQNIYDLANKWAKRIQCKELCDLKLLACRLQWHVVEQLKSQEDGCARGEMVAKLCTSFCHTATAYQHEANNLDAAHEACTKAHEAVQELRRIVQGGVSAALEEEAIVIQLDLLFRQLEVSVARCESEEDRTATFLLLQQARDIMARSKTQAADSSSKLSRLMPRRFGILTFNLAIQELKKSSQAGNQAAVHWSSAAAELFGDCGTDEKLNHAKALTIVGKAMMLSGGELEAAYPKLLLAYELSPDHLSSIHLLECLIKLDKWEGADGLMTFLLSAISAGAYAASEDKDDTVKSWLAFITLVVKAQKFDLSNRLYTHLVAQLGSEVSSKPSSGADVDCKTRKNWERAHVAWIAAVSAHFSDLQKVEELVDQFIRHSAEQGLSQVTRRKMLATCQIQVKDLDDSGRGQRSIEWRKRALEFAETGDDQNEIRRQIAKASLRMGDLETANSYLQLVDQGATKGKRSLDDKILHLQVAAKGGNAEETQKLLTDIALNKEGVPSNYQAELFAMACLAAHESGWDALARDCLELLIKDVILASSSPLDLPDLDVDKVLAEFLKFARRDTGERGASCSKTIAVFELLITKIQTQQTPKLLEQTLNVIADALSDEAVALHETTAGAKSDPLSYTQDDLETLQSMAKLWHLAAQFALLNPKVTDEAKDRARQNLFQAATCNVIISRQIPPADLRTAEGKQRLLRALGCLDRLQELRQNEAASGKSGEAEFLMRLEVEVMLETNGANVDKEVETFLERSMPDGAFILRCLRLCKFKWQHPAIAKGSLRLANQYIQGFSKDEDRDWQKLADILLLRIILSLQHTLNRQQEVEPRGALMDLFKPLPNVIKESGGKFPELHAQAACVYAFNYGIKAFTFGRKAEAEQFLGMSFTLSKACPFVDKQTMAKISQAYETVLH